MARDLSVIVTAAVALCAAALECRLLPHHPEGSAGRACGAAVQESWSGTVLHEDEPAGTIVAKTVGPEGGVLEVTDPASPIAGTIVDIPRGALRERETIRISREGKLPSALGPGIEPLSDVLVLTKDTSSGFARPVSVTVPARLASGDTPAVVYWNPERGSWSSVTTTGVDRARGRVTFRTAHFTKFVVVHLPGLGQIVLRNPFWKPSAGDVTEITSGLAIDTGFDPKKDGMAFENTGDTQADGVSNGGDCAGMSEISALWYVERRRGLPPLRAAFPGDSPRLHDFVNVAQRLQKEMPPQPLAPDRGLATGYELIEQLQATGEPQLLAIHFPDGKGGGGGHGMVVVGYKDGHFLIYDPAFPDELIQYDFGSDGFGALHHADGQTLGGSYDHITSVGTSSLSDIGGETELLRLMGEADEHPVQRPSKVIQLSTVYDGAGTTQVSGHVGGNTEKLRVEITLDGQALDSTPTDGGDFTALIAQRRLRAAGYAPGSVVEVAVVLRAADGSYAGGTAFEVVVEAPPAPPTTSRGLVGGLGDLGGGVLKEPR
jgi:hypothetical protein